MAKKKKGKGFSVDEYFAGYVKGKRKEEKPVSELLEASRREKEEARRKELESYERLSDVGGRETGGGERLSEAGGREPERGERLREEKEMIRSRPLALEVYALRSFAITVMALLMLFILEKRVPGFERAAGWLPPSMDTFIEFALANIILLLALFLLLFGLQLLYYIIYWVAHRKWKEYAREEIVYSILFALIGLAGSVLIVWALGY